MIIYLTGILVFWYIITYRETFLTEMYPDGIPLAFKLFILATWPIWAVWLFVSLLLRTSYGD